MHLFENIYNIAWGATLINVGLCLDIYGATKIIRSFFKKTGEDIHQESASKWDSNPNLTYSLLEQKIDAMIGGLFLFCGFILQLFGNNLSKPQDIKIDWILTLIGSVIFILIFRISGKVFERRRLVDYFFIIISFQIKDKDEMEEQKSQIEINNFINELEIYISDKNILFEIIKRYIDSESGKEKDIEIIKKNCKKVLNNPRKIILQWPLNIRVIDQLLKWLFKI